MIYISDLTQEVSIPRHTTSSAESYRLVLTSNMTDSFTIVEEGEDVSTNPLFYKFELSDLSSLTVGEYTYTLYNDFGAVLERGLLVYGDYEREVVVNNTFSKEKIQYNG